VLAPLLPAGVEYIISRRLYEGLHEEEKRYWHSHVYEVRKQRGRQWNHALGDSMAD
jgi:hypothetical protein